MTPPRGEIFTLKHVTEAVRAHPSLPKQTRSTLCSAVARFCEIAAVDPSEVIADPTAVRELRKLASWQLAGVDKRTWANIVSGLTRAMSIVGVDIDRRRRNTRLLPAWEHLLAHLAPELWKRLRRFAGWCSAREIAPADVTPQTFDAFFDFLQTQSVQRHIRERWHEARRAWNKAVARPGTAFPYIENNTPQPWRSLTWSAFSEELQAELQTWRIYLASPDIEDDRSPLRPITIKNYDLFLRRFASHLVAKGVLIEEIVSLSDLLDIDRLKSGLRSVQGADDPEKARARLHATVQALLSIARFLEVAPGEPGFQAQQKQFALLRRIAGRVRGQASGMVSKNRERLARLSSPTAERRFLDLHQTVAARNNAVAQPTLAQAHEMQMAAVHALLLALPLRIKNVAALDLDAHISRPPGGVAGRWRIAFAADEMKNHRAYEAFVDEETSAFLSDYVSRFRPLQLANSSTILFKNRKGRAKQPTTLSKQYSNFIRRELGLTVHPHLLRHHAGMLWLNHMPGECEPLSKLLGHSSARTTAAAYTGAETKTAQHRYHELLGSLRARDRSAGLTCARALRRGEEMT